MINKKQAALCTNHTHQFPIKWTDTPIDPSLLLLLFQFILLS